MNNYLTVFLILLLVIVFFLLLRSFIPSLKHVLSNLPKWAILLMMAVVTVVIVILVRSLMTTGGAFGGDGEGSGSSDELPVLSESAAVENCIIMSADSIIIEGRDADMNYLNEYITLKAGSNTKITLVDNYATSALYHEVESLCKDKGVNYDKEDETWLQ